MLIYREDNLARVAKVVIKYNPFLKGSTVESVVKRMKATAESADHSPKYGYVATGGAEHCFT